MQASQARPLSTNPWWVYLFQGIASVIVGWYLLGQPAKTIAVLVVAFGIFVVISGIVTLFSMFANREGDVPWGWKLIAGILQIIIGVFVAGHPLLGIVVAPTVLAFFLAFSAIFGGVALMASGQGFGAVLAGIITFIMGFVLLANPFLSAVALVNVVGFLGIIGGIALIFSSFTVARQ